MTELYFAYGSNMSSPRIRARIAAARAVGPAYLERHRLVCNKRGKDGTGKANLESVPTVDRVERVAAWGVIFAVPLAAWSLLDRYEWGYERKPCDVHTGDGRRHSAQLYVALAPEAAAIPPFDWYRDHCLEGAREHGLPEEIVRLIEGWEVHR